MPLNEELSKEQFSIAYVTAIAARAGFACERVIIDRDSVDLVVREGGGRHRTLELQLKCTGRFLEPAQTDFPFDLSVKNYNDLRTADSLSRLLLVVVVVPRRFRTCIDQSRERLMIRNCAYFHDLRGADQVANTRSVRLRISRDAVLGVDALTRFLLQDSVRTE